MMNKGFRVALAAASCAAAAFGTAGAAGASGAAGAAGAAGAHWASAARAAAPPTYGATITVNISGKIAGQISNHFVGLSFESGTLASSKFDNVGDLARMLKNLGSSVMRFGGASVDQKSYKGASASTLAGLARLAKASGWTVLYSENLGTFSSTTRGAVTADARRVSVALGSHLFAIACGNEPELFVRKGIRSAPYTEADFLAEDASCLAAVHAGAPKATLAGPDTFVVSWLLGYAPDARKVGVIVHHYYPLGCTGRPPAQVVATLLSPALTAKEAAMFNTMAGLARSARKPFWLDETNTAACGGVHGLSNSYASALWAVDFMLTGAEHGVSGMNFHGALSTSCRGYTPLCQVAANEYAAQPVYYGMLFTHLLGSGHLLPVTVATTARAANIAAFALRPLTGGLRLIVENLSPDTASTRLRVGGHPASATVLHLTGPSLLATSGVRIQGAAVAANGSFAPGKPNTVRCSAGSCQVTIPPYTAVLVTVG